MANAGDLLAEAAHILDRAGVSDSRREARLILAHVLGKDVSAVFARPERVVEPAQAKAFEALVTRRAAREPLSRILGVREFWGLPFRLSPDTLDPRPDSETLVEAVLDRIPDLTAPLRLLDLGTGSGCLLLALLAELPSATGTGVDISPGAIATASSNAGALGLAGRAQFVAGDWFAPVSGRYDIIVVNPPYIPDADIDALEPEVAKWDPRRALAGGKDGLAPMRALAGQFGKYLTDQGLVAVEIGAGQADAVSVICTATGLDVIEQRADLNGVVRCLLMRPTKAR